MSGTWFPFGVHRVIKSVLPLRLTCLLLLSNTMTHFFPIHSAAQALTRPPSQASTSAPPTPSPSPTASATPSQSTSTTTLQGRVLEQGTRRPMEGVNVFVLPHKLRSTTDAQGNFSIGDVPAGPFQWVINQSGYLKLEQGDEAKNESAEEPRTLYIEKNSYQVFETTIFGRGNKRDDTTRSLKAKQAVEAPGSFGDPIRAVQNLPGVARTNSSQVVIQGGSPNDTRYLIDDHEVPLIFHFGGFTSVLFPEAVDRIDYLSAGYGAEYSSALGGLINVTSKKPRSDRWGGVAFMDVINAGVLAEGPLNEKSSALVSARYSYVGQVVKAISERMNDRTANLTVAPYFADLNLVYHNQLSAQDEFKFTGVASQDSLELILNEPLDNNPSIRGKFENRTEFFRLIPQYSRKIDEKSDFRLSLSHGLDVIRNETETIYFRIRRWYTGVRSEYENRSSESWTQFYGLDNQYSRARVEVNVPIPFSSGGVSNPVGTNDKRQANVDSRDYGLGFYTRQELRVGPWTLLPQLRGDYFKATDEYLASPRLGVRFELDPYRFIRFASGFYYQPPEPQEVDETYGNPALLAPRNIHYALGYEEDFRRGQSAGLKGGVGFFWKEMDRLVVNSTNFVSRNGSQVPENFNNDGMGRAYGMEVSAQWEQNPWTAVLAYTLSRSLRWNPLQGTLLSSNDQTHNVNLQGSYQSGNWKYATRLRYVTGNPFTPVVGSIYDADNDAFVPLRGALYSDRFEPFFQLDLRIDRKFVYRTWILSAYLDIQNLTNYRSPQSYFYSYDYSRKEAAAGLGLIPSFGLKGEF